MTDLNQLLKWFADTDMALISLSGGVDSALVAYAANKKLGKNAIAVTADYKTLSSEELGSAKSIAVTSKPSFAKVTASYPRPQPITQILPLGISEASL